LLFSFAFHFILWPYIKDGSSNAELDPDFELKNLGLRFENWKKDFKVRRCRLNRVEQRADSA
jgi:hypothetical protein